MKSILYGRELLKAEIPEVLFGEMATYPDVVQTPSLVKNKGNYCCKRCNALMIEVEATECFCKQTCAYSRNCIRMGKVRACEPL